MIFLEHKSLLAVKGPVPVGEHYIPFGQANVVRAGDDLTIVSCGLWLRRSLEAAEQLAAQGISCEVIDLRTIVPLDVETIVASVRKTGRLLVVDEAYAMCGIGAEIAAVVMEHAFDELDAPVGRLHTTGHFASVQSRRWKTPSWPRREDRGGGASRDRRPAADPAARRGLGAQGRRAAALPTATARPRHWPPLPRLPSTPALPCRKRKRSRRQNRRRPRAACRSSCPTWT